MSGALPEEAGINTARNCARVSSVRGSGIDASGSAPSAVMQGIVAAHEFEAGPEHGVFSDEESLAGIAASSALAALTAI